MPSAALMRWQTDRIPRLAAVDTHCAHVATLTVPTFLDETLRGYVLHLAAHFQGFCRDLYTECSQLLIATMPSGMQVTAQEQFNAKLALSSGNPTYTNIQQDFNRFGFELDLEPDLAREQRITSLGHLNAWRNRAAHQGIRPLGGGVPDPLTVLIIQNWRVACDGLATSLDAIMEAELHRILGAAPW